MTLLSYDFLGLVIKSTSEKAEALLLYFCLFQINCVLKLIIIIIRRRRIEFLRILKLEGTEFWRFWKKKCFNFLFPTRILSATVNFIKNILKHTFAFDISVKTGIIKGDSSDYFPTISQTFFPLKFQPKFEKEYLMVAIQERVMIETNIKIFSQS